MRRTMIIVAIWVVWTLACVYGTYANTVKHAELVNYDCGTYEIMYHNTGDIMIYKEIR